HGRPLPPRNGRQVRLRRDPSPQGLRSRSRRRPHQRPPPPRPSGRVRFSKEYTMGPTTMTAQMVRSIGRNLAYNLNYLPPDKLGWKPAPTAKSAFEIATHLAYFQKGMAGVASGAGWTDPGITPPTNLEEARALILQTTEAFAAALEALPPEGLNHQVELP